MLDLRWVPLTLGLLALAQDPAPKPGATLIPRWALRPHYPRASRTKGEAGTVHARFQVRQDGTVASVRILKAPSEGLAESVRSAILKWAFEPFELAEPGQCLEAAIQIDFKLED